ncbi:gamma-glutamyltransferase family protein [Planctobacterium marinum]|uniref:gamma-glutamyltransferase family protein n=1 Tax=Planctobacterium marinum TaxID=1631968 RepID=UPI001E4E8FEC|nr:gamma-glutamyltransferase [Planctobacterium marinum]MCC2603982.1 gamma-glutamyltransferase family protein [Planctobacterium marinum]
MIGFTAPHHAAAEAGTEVLQNGGTAIEAMVAAAATIAVVYPHMNGLGGDGFWLISEPGKPPVAIDACGTACRSASPVFYQGLAQIPSRGPGAALTMAGAVAGWQQALNISAQWQTPQPLAELLQNAVNHAQTGIEVTQSLQDASLKTQQEFQGFDAFRHVFSNNGEILEKGQKLQLKQLGNTLHYLGEQGLQSFYQGDIAQSLANDLAAVGSPVSLADFQAYQANQVTPLSVKTTKATLYNLPAPTQGLASLMILALFDKVQHLAQSEADVIHLLIECTKQAFIVRNNTIADPSRLTAPQSSWLTTATLDELAANISVSTALPWPHEARPGDTVWMGCCDNQGRMVSYIQSLYWEFGSGIVSPSTGIVWNNRGTSFSLAPQSLQYLQPGLKPFHTLNPAYAQFHNGDRMVYGTMGGEGQPQTQAALFSRFAYLGKSLQDAVTEPRWLLGRTWGDVSHNLKIEENLSPQIKQALQDKGHDIAVVQALNEMMGHAGVVHLSTSQQITAVTDPRSDGKGIAQEVLAS